MLNKYEGIVLKARDYGESHQILTVYTKNQGKVSFMARGSKKTKSRFGAVTEPFTRAHFVSFGNGNIATLSQADLISSHHLLRSDLLLTAYGAYWLELIDKTTEEKEADPFLYDLLTSLLEHLEQKKDPDILTFILELSVLKTAGYTPVTDRCVSCGSGRHPVRFSIRQGGWLCERCQDQDQNGILVSVASIRILRILQQVDPHRLGKIDVKPETKEQLEKMIRGFVEEYLPVRLKSLQLLEQFKKIWT
ncbi:DNA repair protein RecO [Thermoactinomyces intermedius]|uniref:DNA repair protein RecO n=1 Tax=Thermoactinomyces intermedius TaxID=2024 RepID=A0A8I1DDL7_THEIN|nr:DNA repair protein RecO [Thermoactinomyces intermedius]MBA4547744.1 DNA repair protein RecO [Thermoactinomyces intermedius]MBA4836645.1 DNA repair protein RecO [Thermoactinomyces intermedius]MBH8594027.1 DNA repair protein RecO [Thermoactinomyces intermedius]MBH8600076.1 DNA repair protein RecO [Thermoactinomyces sp. CICC 23799]